MAQMGILNRKLLNTRELPCEKPGSPFPGFVRGWKCENGCYQWPPWPREKTSTLSRLQPVKSQPRRLGHCSHEWSQLGQSTPSPSHGITLDIPSSGCDYKQGMGIQPERVECPVMAFVTTTILILVNSLLSKIGLGPDIV